MVWIHILMGSEWLIKRISVLLSNLIYVRIVLFFYKRGYSGGRRGNFKINILKVMDSVNKEKVKIKNINEIKTKIFYLKNKIIKRFIRCELDN